MQKNLKKGFTLIELLVVIAIIGILSAIALSAMNKARDKARDSAIKQELSSIRNKSELYFNNIGNFGDSEDSCEEGMFSQTENDAPGSLILNLKEKTTLTCSTDLDEKANSWSVSAVLLDNSDDSWCVDSSGFSGFGEDVDQNGKCD